MSILKKIRRLRQPANYRGLIGQAHETLLAYQHKVAGYLNRKSAGWSASKTKWILILFCLITGNLCLYIIGKAILSDNGPPAVIKIQKLKVPEGIRAKDFKSADSIIQNHH